MAGSNRSPVQPNGPALRGRQQWDADPQARQQAQPQAPYPAQDDPMMRWALQGQGQPGHPAAAAYPAPGQPYPAPGQPHPHYADFGTPQQPADYGHPDPYAQPQLQGYPDPITQGRGQQDHYDRYQQAPHHYGQAYPAAPGGHYAGGHGETQGFDLSQYAPGQPAPQRGIPAGHPAPGGYPAGHDAQGYGRAYAEPAADYQHYQQHPGQPAPQGRDPYNLDQYAHQAPGQGYADPQDYDHQQQHHQGLDADGQPLEDQDGAYEDDIEEPAPSRGPRAMLVAGALVGAIAVGGGLAYGYRMLGAKDGGKPPVVRADQSPAKLKPADPGGKDVAHTDKKFLNRLTEEKGAPTTVAAAAQTPSDPEAPRKVTTLVVNKDGTLVPQAAPPAPPAPPASSVPGMVIEGLRPQLRGDEGPPPVAQTPAIVNAAPPPPAAPKVADLPLPRVRPEAAATPPPPAKKKPAVRDDALAPQQPQAKAAVASAPATTGTIVGYVPVLASKRSREDALKSFADMHQKYPDLLSGRSPDVMEANIPDKGTYYRLIVGPPGSKEAARDLCKKLESQGFKDCWATGYRQ